MLDSDTPISSHPYWIPLAILVFTLALGGALSFWFFGLSPFPATGSLYVSLPNEKGNSALYRYDVGSSQSYPVVSLKNREEIITDAAVEPHGSSVAFVTSNRKRTESHIHIRANDTKKVRELPSDKAFKKNISWSADGTLLSYASPNLSSDNALLPQSWNIFVSDLSGKKHVVTRGVSPIFLFDSRIIVVRDDGLYVFTTGTEPKGKKIWDMKGTKANATMSLAISRDRKLLAWSNPLESKVFIFTVKDGASVELTLYKTITALAHGIALSPDGNYLALEETVPTIPDKNTVPHISLSVYNLSHLERKVLINSLPMLPVQAGLYDWVLQ